MATRLTTWVAAALVVVVAMGAWVAGASALSPQSLATSLQSDPVQSLGVPRPSFSALSGRQQRALRAEINRLDPGRFWVLVVSPRTQEALGTLAGPVFGELPAGTLIAVADDAQRPTTTHFWIGSSWESSTAAESQLNGVINGFHKGQGSLFDDLRLAIRSFARGDAAAGHPQLSSASSASQPGLTGAGQPGAATGGGQPANASSGGSTNTGLIVLVVIGAIVLAVLAVIFIRYTRRSLRASHRRHEESADAHEQASADFGKLGDQISALDIDSSMPGASAAGKDEYAKALECYDEAERRLRKSDDEYQFERAVAAIHSGLDHVDRAGRLFNGTPAAAPVRHRPDLAGKLEELAALHEQGVLTDVEFADQKGKLLGG